MKDQEQISNSKIHDALGSEKDELSDYSEAMAANDDHLSIEASTETIRSQISSPRIVAEPSSWKYFGSYRVPSTPRRQPPLRKSDAHTPTRLLRMLSRIPDTHDAFHALPRVGVSEASQQIDQAQRELEEEMRRVAARSPHDPTADFERRFAQLRQSPKRAAPAPKHFSFPRARRPRLSSDGDYESFSELSYHSDTDFSQLDWHSSIASDTEDSLVADNMGEQAEEIAIEHNHVTESPSPHEPRPNLPIQEESTEDEHMLHEFMLDESMLDELPAQKEKEVTHPLLREEKSEKVDKHDTSTATEIQKSSDEASAADSGTQPTPPREQEAEQPDRTDMDSWHDDGDFNLDDLPDEPSTAPEQLQPKQAHVDAMFDDLMAELDEQFRNEHIQDGVTQSHMTDIADEQAMAQDAMGQREASEPPVPNASRRVTSGCTFIRRRLLEKAQGMSPTAPKAAIPKRLAKKLFSTFANSKVDPDVTDKLLEVSDLFFEQMADDLEAYTQVAERNKVEMSDLTLLLQRQGFIHDKMSLEALAHQYLPRELWDILCTSALSDNMLYPEEPT